jgi:hypothetical protein
MAATRLIMRPRSTLALREPCIRPDDGSQGGVEDLAGHLRMDRQRLADLRGQQVPLAQGGLVREPAMAANAANNDRRAS